METGESIGITHAALVGLGLAWAVVTEFMRRLHGDVKDEKADRKASEEAIWDAVGKLRDEAASQERRTADKLERVPTKDDLRAEFDRMLSLMSLRGPRGPLE